MNNKLVMGTGKKMIIMLFAFVAAMMAVPQPLQASAAEVIASGNCRGSHGGKWELDADGVLAISGRNELYEWDGHENVYYKSSIKSVVIEDGITSIGFRMFRDCTSLTDVTIPKSITSIAGSTFPGCSSLTDIAMPADVTSIGSYAFNGCASLKDIIIPNSVKRVVNGTFKGCTSLTGVTILESVQSIVYDIIDPISISTILIVKNPSYAYFVGWFSYNTWKCDFPYKISYKDITLKAKWETNNAKMRNAAPLILAIHIS